MAASPSTEIDTLRKHQALPESRDPVRLSIGERDGVGLRQDRDCVQPQVR